MADALSRCRWCREGEILRFVLPVILTIMLLPPMARPSDACTDGETQPCALQQGVCLESLQTCADGEWQACDYGRDFEELESLCDRRDNDCDGIVDNVDFDNDGDGVCPIPKEVNELLLSSYLVKGSTVTIYEYRDGFYDRAWSAYRQDIGLISGSGEAGDLTGDGLPEIAFDWSVGFDDDPYRIDYHIDVWSLNIHTGEWFAIWTSPNLPLDIGDIADVDDDGVNELIVTSNFTDTMGLYSWDGHEFIWEATVRDCAPAQANYVAAAGDLDGDGTPEILFQCSHSEDLQVYEFDGNGYPVVGTVPLPEAWPGQKMLVDDIESGDVNGDGRADAVFCGNSDQAHVVEYNGSGYTITYSTPKPANDDGWAGTCSVGDITNDGTDDFVVVLPEGAKVYSHDGNQYQEVWAGPPRGDSAYSGSSFVGDSDNDGFTEFLFPLDSSNPMMLYENDVVGATSFTNTHIFEGKGPLVIIGNLDPTNDKTEIDCNDTDPARGAAWFCGTDYSRPAAGSGGGVGGTRWSDEFTVCNTTEDDRELLFTFTERGDSGQPVRKRAETISGDACVTYSDPVGQWFGVEAYGALLVDVMNGPAGDIRISGLFKGETENGVMGQFFASSALDDAVTTDAYILTTTDPEQNRLGTGFQAAEDGTDLEITLENPIGEIHWRRVLKKNWKAGDNELYGKIERHAPGVSNLVIHYRVNEGAVVPFGTVTDNESGDPAARGPAVPATSLVLPVIGKTSGAAGVDWFSEFLIANLTQEPNTVQLNLYIGRLLTGEINLGPGEVLGHNDLISQIDWRDAGDSPVSLEEGVGALEIVAENTIIAGSKFNSVDRETGRVMGLSLEAMAEPNLVPGSEYLFLGVRNKDETGVVRARLNFTNLTDDDATLSVDVLRQDGTLVGSFEKVARAKRFSDWRIPKSLTEVGETYTLRVTSTQPGYAFLSQINESNDAICNYPLVVIK